MTTADGSVPGAHPDAAAAVRALARWLKAREFEGWDPYDALASPVVRALAPGRWGKVAWTQLLRRSPVQFRGVLRVPRLPNPKADALALEACLRFPMEIAPEPLVARLERAATPRGGWGYPFAWANRDAYVPAGTPNAVVTAFVGHALLDARGAGLTVAGGVLEGAGRFLAEGLARIPGPGGFCFSYTAVDRRPVHNASVLAASLLARLAPVCGREEWARDARAAARHTLAAQRADGSWPYGPVRNNGWVDSFHTGYVLIALDRLAPDLDGEVEPAVARGLRHWVETFLVPPAVAHRPGVPYPVDMHAVAHAILTLLHFRDRVPGASARARALADWSLAEMRAADGSFHYLRYAGRTNRLPYFRWVQAWMLRALAELARAEREVSPSVSERPAGGTPPDRPDHAG